jgi:hypothetical protein
VEMSSSAWDLRGLEMPPPTSTASLKGKKKHTRNSPIDDQRSNLRTKDHPTQWSN